MARTLSITDDELGVKASVRVESHGDTHLVTDVHFQALEGSGITAAALRLIEDLGLRLPEQVTPVAAQRRKRGPAKKAAAAKPRKAAKTAPVKATVGSAADDDDLARDTGSGTAAPDPPAVPELPAALRARELPAGTTGRQAAPAQRKAYRTGAPPKPDELAELFQRHEGNVVGIAEELGASRSTVGNWIRTAREQGHKITYMAPDEQPAS